MPDRPYVHTSSPTRTAALHRPLPLQLAGPLRTVMPVLFRTIYACGYAPPKPPATPRRRRPRPGVLQIRDGKAARTADPVSAPLHTRLRYYAQVAATQAGLVLPRHRRQPLTSATSTRTSADFSGRPASLTVSSHGPRVHDLRHTFGQQPAFVVARVMTSAPYCRLQTYLGHASLATHLLPATDRESIPTSPPGPHASATCPAVAAGGHATDFAVLLPVLTTHLAGLRGCSRTPSRPTGHVQTPDRLLPRPPILPPEKLTLDHIEPLRSPVPDWLQTSRTTARRPQQRLPRSARSTAGCRRGPTRMPAPDILAIPPSGSRNRRQPSDRRADRAAPQPDRSTARPPDATCSPPLRHRSRPGTPPITPSATSACNTALPRDARAQDRTSPHDNTTALLGHTRRAPPRPARPRRPSGLLQPAPPQTQPAGSLDHPQTPDQTADATVTDPTSAPTPATQQSHAPLRPASRCPTSATSRTRRPVHHRIYARASTEAKTPSLEAALHDIVTDDLPE